MLHVHRSNDAGRLVESLAGLVSTPLPDPLARETIVVQGRGMERWLSMELARRLGVWANPWFPFPRSLLDEATRAVLGVDAAAAFEPEALVWRVARLLPERIAEASFAPIRAYLEHDARGSRLVELAAEIAAVFDRYLLYRPVLIRAWEEGRDAGGDAWQPVLWRAIVGAPAGGFGKGDARPLHLAARIDALVERLESGTVDLPDFPRRVSLFGISTLAPSYLRAFAALGRAVDVHLFLLAPSREFMGAVVEPKEESRLRKAHGGWKRPAEPADLHLDRSALLASLGRLGREFQDLLQDVEPAAVDEELFVDPGAGTMLHVLQSDVLNLVERGTDDAEPLPLVADGEGLADRSIQVHSCHSRMREVEVLHDQLLHLLESDPTLEPRHVIVMAPAIDDYAPYVDAVFTSESGRRRGRRRIPCHVSDRGPRAERAVDAFFRILEVLRGRMSAPEVVDLLAMDVVRERFAIAASELDAVREWVREAGVRWGVDETHRAAEGQPAIRENTWRFGLDRLLLGFALDGSGRRMFGGVLPVDGIEGTAADLLGRFAEYCETLFSFRGLAEDALAVPGWQRELGAVLDRLVALGPDNADQHDRIRRALEALAERAAAAGFDRPIRLEALHRELEKEIGASAAAHGFLSGGVTFCSMVPMRSIPFRVIYLLGMNDADFPRSVRPPGFDLTARAREPGDRTRRDDDRHLFLETILSARQTLALSYVGQSIQDNTPIPPSVVVSDLLDALARSFVVAGEAAADPFERRARLVERIVARHPLQPFSDRYFRTDRADPRMFSFSLDALEGARAERNAGEAPPFVTAPLPAASPAASDVPVVSLDDLEAFLQHPSRWFCRRRLGLSLGGDVSVLEEAEPIELDALERWNVGDRLLPRLISGETADQAFAALRASGALPPGALGRGLYEGIAREAERLAREARRLVADAALEPVEVDREVGGVRLTGFLRELRSCGQLDVRFSRLGGKHELSFWLRHLVLHLVAPGEVMRDTFLIGRADEGNREPHVVARFTEVKEPERILATIVGLYLDGASRPVPLFVKSSRAYAETLRTKPDDAIGAARKLFQSQPGTGNDGDDVYVKKLFGPAYDPGADAEFATVARAVFDPLLASREVIA